ncbi:MAG: alpha-L-rhamnosidase N-terminal domain-containing protein [Pirellulales bacterium]|nr:alpha-L-rhamnosidase N-terminal domain-containing protein [Pirellulales bacterium]
MTHHLPARIALAVCSLLWILALGGPPPACRAAENAPQWEADFRSPPDAARPWVYWFWLNSNITREGLTADLEAMKRAGVGGVLIMEVDQGAPVGTVPFAGPQWLDLFKHACSEANRLGIEINMNNDAGWNGSGGPWNKPENSMQKIVFAETKVEGPKKFQEKLRQPQAVKNYYRDITVLAFPTPEGKSRIPHLSDKALFGAGLSTLVAPAAWPAAPADETISPDRLVDISAKMDKEGQLTWDVPDGKWTILRLGHTTTGVENHPSPASGSGLECDKMSKEAAEAHFAGLIGKIIEKVGPLAGKTLVATHIDSWENGSQNWTPKFREEFQKRRGYDMLPFLPAMTGRIVGSRETSERFLWDVRQTISELVLQNYAGHFREMAHRHGMKLTIEGYSGCPCDELAYGGYADEPIGEFWAWWFGTNKTFGFSFSATQMASVAHVYGKKIVGAEAFTSCNTEKWLGHPGNIKTLGDWAFCEGINRFIFHRYAMQPWLNVQPGMTMGPWGLHYERTQTWWEMSKAWHEYLARCQYLLREGLHVADVCYLGADAAPQCLLGQKRLLAKTPDPLDPDNPDYPRERIDYSFDVASTDALLTRMSVADGRIVLPDGMSYRLLVLPNVETMTPKALGKIKELVEAGATAVGSRPAKSPSLSDYPQCDAQVQRLAAELWGPGEAPAELTARQVGKGRMFWSAAFQVKSEIRQTPQELLSSAQWIWFPEGNPAASAPPGRRYFQKTFAVDGPVESAQLAVTADNRFTAWLGGRKLGAGNTHLQVFTFDIAPSLKQGENLLAVEAANTTESATPAGLIAKLTILYRDGRRQNLVTDATWKTAKTAPETWKSLAGDDWAAAKMLGEFGMAPWGEMESDAPHTELLPEVDLVTEVLRKMDVRPDFTHQAKSGTKSLRYIHRTEKGNDLYFVANKYPRHEEALCSFRVEGKRPELWWPDTGKIERPAVYADDDGAVRVPISLDAHGSVFVVFRDKAAPPAERIVSVSRDGREIVGTAWQANPPSSADGKPLPVEDSGVKLAVDASNRLDFQAAQTGKYTLTYGDGATRQIEIAQVSPPIELSGAWEVAFDPRGGGPAKVEFDKLVSWSEHPDEGVKYYSGTATYAKTFTVPADRIAKGRRCVLDLGKVEVMAEVILNGKSLGILWKPPYHVDLGEALKPGENKLEVKVVNLLINRQIGDEFLPEDSDRNPNGTLKSWPKWLLEGKTSPTGRHTFTSWRMWRKDDPLQPSGLIGPVQIVPHACPASSGTSSP